MTRTNDAWPRSCDSQDFASHKRRQSYKNVKSLSELSTLHGTLLVLLKDVVSGKRKAWRSLRSFYSDAQVRGRDESQVHIAQIQAQNITALQGFRFDYFYTLRKEKNSIIKIGNLG